MNSIRQHMCNKLREQLTVLWVVDMGAAGRLARSFVVSNLSIPIQCFQKSDPLGTAVPTGVSESAMLQQRARD